ncbi:MAG: chemotaxis protein CheW [Alphaproteobacteria bacterium]|nr:chemotaxis protein CheW [Alphaproteobacteria bacterium]
MADVMQYVTIGVANELFAAPVDRVQEILDMCPISRLPRAPANLLGMIDVRGEGTPVYDLRSTLDMPGKEDTENTRIVVLFVSSGKGDIRVGLRADRVIEVTALDNEALDPPPRMRAAEVARAVVGIGRRNGAFVTVLDLDHLLGEEAASILAA